MMPWWDCTILEQVQHWSFGWLPPDSDGISVPLLWASSCIYNYDWHGVVEVINTEQQLLLLKEMKALNRKYQLPRAKQEMFSGQVDQSQLPSV